MPTISENKIFFDNKKLIKKDKSKIDGRISERLDPDSLIGTSSRSPKAKASLLEYQYC